MNLRGSPFRRTVRDELKRDRLRTPENQKFENFDADGWVAIYLSGKVRQKFQSMFSEEITETPIFSSSEGLQPYGRIPRPNLSSLVEGR